jgi:uncharacterized protein YegP (UPF0339 family)
MESAMRRDRIETCWSDAGHFWNMRGSNGKVMLDGAEGYKTKAGLKKALLRLKDRAADIPRMVDEALAALDKK